MTFDQIQRLLRTRPFRPFRVHMSDGRAFDVRHPELVAFIRGMERTMILGFPREDAYELIDLLHVSSIGDCPRRAGGRRRSSAN